MDDLLTRKENIVAEYLPKFTKERKKTYKTIAKLIKKAVKDRKINIKFETEILDKIRLGGHINSTPSKGMDGEQKLEIAKIWLKETKSVVDDIRNDQEFLYKSYLKSIDEEMESCRKRIEQIDKEIEKAENEERIKKLEQKQGELIAKRW